MNSKGVITHLTSIIVDDELHGRENLKLILKSYCADIKVLGCSESVVKAIDMVRNCRPDVVFLDINMPVLDGFDFLDEFKDRDFLVVFVSAHEEFGIQAVKAGAVDYLLKPINIKELKQTVKNLLVLKNKRIKSEPPISELEQLVIPASHGFDLLGFEDIIRLEADGCYTILVLKGGRKKIVSRTLKEFEAKLPTDLFFRVHKSHLINLKFIREYSNLGGNLVTMTDGSKVELSRRKTPEFLFRIKEVLKAI